MPPTTVLVRIYASFLVATAAKSLTSTPLCELMYGKVCNPAETVLQAYNALWKLQVGVILATLISAGEITLELKNYVFYSNMLQFSGVLMFGTHVLNGAFDDTIHLVACIAHFVFLMALLLPVEGESLESVPMNLGGITCGNPKGYLLVVAAYFVLWLFVNTQQPCTEVLLDPADFSVLAQLLWNWWSVGALETVLFLWYTVAYGSEHQQRNVALALAAMQPIALVTAHVLQNKTTTAIYVMTTVSFSLVMIFGVLATTAATTAETAVVSLMEKAEKSL